MSRELSELSAELRAMLSDANATLVLATAPLSHAARVHASVLRPQHAVAVAAQHLSVSEGSVDADGALGAHGPLGVLACAELSDASVECAAHVRENGRCTLLVSSLGRVVRFYTRDARIVERSDALFSRLLPLLPLLPDASLVRNFVLLPVDSIIETAVGVAQTALDRSIDGLPGLRSAAVARAYDDDDDDDSNKKQEKDAAKHQADLTSVQSVPPVDESKDGLNHTYPGFALVDDDAESKPRSRRPSSLLQVDVAAPPKADTFSYAATALLLGFMGGYAVALKLKH